MPDRTDTNSGLREKTILVMIDWPVRKEHSVVKTICSRAHEANAEARAVSKLEGGQCYEREKDKGANS